MKWFFIPMRKDVRTTDTIIYQTTPNHVHMKTCLSYYILTFFIFSSSLHELGAQICRDTALHLDENGKLTLDPSLILDPDVDPEFEPIITPANFTCDHVGEN